MCGLTRLVLLLQEGELIDVLNQTIEFFANSVEVKGWGFNLLSLSTLGIVFFGCLEAWALFNQNKGIWSKRSGDSISVSLFTYLASYFAASIVYGVSINSLSVVLNCAILVLFYIPIILGLWKFKKWTAFDIWASLGYLLMVPLIAFLPWTEVLYLIFSFGTIYSMATQPYELWKKKDVGVLDIRLVGVYFASCCFWTVYAFTADALALKILNPPILILLALTWWLWRKYRCPPSPSA